MIAPICTIDKYKTFLDIQLNQAINGVFKDCCVKLYFIQPILKIDLLKFANRISNEKIKELKAALIYFWGLSG